MKKPGVKPEEITQKKLGFFRLHREFRAHLAGYRLPKVRREICSNPVSLGSFSKARHPAGPAILEQVFESLSQEVRARHGASMEGLCPPPISRFSTSNAGASKLFSAE